MPVEACMTCHGRGVIMKEVKPGKWENQKCPAGCRNGKVNKRLL